VWRPVAIAIAMLVAVNFVARLIVRLADPDTETEFVVGLASLGAMATVAAVLAFLWTKRHATARVVQDALVVVTVTSILVTLVGPFVFGKTLGDFGTFTEWLAVFLLQLLICFAVLGIGVFTGSLLAIAVGVDPTSRAWKEQAARVPAATKPKAKPKAKVKK
jgi:hypothetical protein